MAATPARITDIEKAGLVVIVGSNNRREPSGDCNASERAHKMHGQKLDRLCLPQEEMGERADVSSIRPRTDLIGCLR